MTPWLDDGDVQLYHGDVIQTLRSLPAGIAQTCVTSPPYWGLRDYGTGEWTGGDTTCAHVERVMRPSAKSTLEDHGEDGRSPQLDALPGIPYRDACGRCGARRVDSQLGLEATPDLYVERLVAVFREVWRVLRDDGTVWLNLGDSYAGSWGAQSRDAERGGAGPSGMERASSSLSATQITAHPRGQTNTGSIPAGSGLKPKDLVGVPWRVAFALQADGWYLRSDIVWSKPNPMPESVSDRPTKAHEYLFLLAKQPRYFYDQDAIREPHESSLGGRTPREDTGNGHSSLQLSGRGGVYHDAGRNRRSVWTIATAPFPEAHFATYPQALVRPCILAGTSEGACDRCGAPFERVASDGRRATGWRPSCSCSPSCVCPIAQTVLDPFIGSGTTALVARNHGRRCIGIDLSAEYLAIAAKRLQQLSLFGGVA